MRFPDLLVQFKELEQRQRMIDTDLRAIRAQLIRIEGARDYLGPDVSRGTHESVSVEDTHAHQPTLFDAA